MDAMDARRYNKEEQGRTVGDCIGRLEEGSRMTSQHEVTTGH